MNKAIIMWCWWFELTKRMTKPYCGTFCAHSSSSLKPTVLRNSCKTQPQAWQGARHQAEQPNRTKIFVPGFYLTWSLSRICRMPLLFVLADGGLCGGFCSSWPGRMPLRSGFIWQCFHRGCSLHASWHGHWNSKYDFTVWCVCTLVSNLNKTNVVQSFKAHSHKHIVLQTYCPVTVYLIILVVLHNLCKTVVLHTLLRNNLFNNSYPCW